MCSVSGDAVNNPASDDAREGDEDTSSSSILNELYQTLGHVQAGIDVRQQEARTAREQAQAAEQDLLKQRQAAIDQDDPEAFARVTEQLEQLQRVYRVLDHDLGAARAPDQHADRHGEGDERDRDRDRPDRGD
jgi:hypothetical protein